METFIEIGVQKALFADQVISKWPSLIKYYGIDAWKNQENYIDGSNVNDNRQMENYHISKENLKKYGAKIELIRHYSNLVVNQFQDKSIDFIYVDARHDFCGAYEDLSLYFPKLKCNGVMAGHDYQSVKESLTANNNFELCANGSKILTNGGAVKGYLFNFEIYIYLKKSLQQNNCFKKCLTSSSRRFLSIFCLFLPCVL